MICYVTISTLLSSLSLSLSLSLRYIDAILGTLCDPALRGDEAGYYGATFSAAVQHIRELELEALLPLPEPPSPGGAEPRARRGSSSSPSAAARAADHGGAAATASREAGDGAAAERPSFWMRQLRPILAS